MGFNQTTCLTNMFFPSLFSRPLLRRSSDGGLGTSENLATQNFDPLNTSHLHNSTAGAPTGTHLSTSSTSGMMNAGGTGGAGHRRAHSSMSGRYPRSWHPSPFGSEDEASATEEPQFYKEEKKNRIKMEIARRRQQIGKPNYYFKISPLDGACLQVS